MVPKYKFVGELRKTGEKVILCEWDNIKLFELLMREFDYSDTISRFYIEENNAIIKEKVLAPDAKKSLVRRKEYENNDNK